MRIRYAEEILELVTMEQLMEAYHHTGRQHRVDCPFHNGRDNNFCYDGVVYHCWVCGAKGNVITFVRELFGLSFADAIAKLNEDFRLGLPIGQTMSLRQRRELLARQNDRRREKERRCREQEAEERRKDAILGEWVRLERNLREYAPKTPEEELHPLYVEAAHRIDYQNYLMQVYF